MNEIQAKCCIEIRKYVATKSKCYAKINSRPNNKYMKFIHTIRNFLALYLNRCKCTN